MAGTQTLNCKTFFCNRLQSSARKAGTARSRGAVAVRAAAGTCKSAASHSFSVGLVCELLRRRYGSSVTKRILLASQPFASSFVSESLHPRRAPACCCAARHPPRCDVHVSCARPDAAMVRVQAHGCRVLTSRSTLRGSRVTTDSTLSPLGPTRTDSSGEFAYT